MRPKFNHIKNSDEKNRTRTQLPSPIVVRYRRTLITFQRRLPHMNDINIRSKLISPTSYSTAGKITPTISNKIRIVNMSTECFKPATNITNLIKNEHKTLNKCPYSLKHIKNYAKKNRETNMHFGRNSAIKISEFNKPVLNSHYDFKEKLIPEEIIVRNIKIGKCISMKEFFRKIKYQKRKLRIMEKEKNGEWNKYLKLQIKCFPNNSTNTSPT